MAFIHAVLAIVNVPFVTAYFTKSVPRQIVDQGKRRIAYKQAALGKPRAACFRVMETAYITSCRPCRAGRCCRRCGGGAMAKRRGARSEIVVVRSRANRRDTRFGVLPRSSLSILLTLPTLTDSKTVAESEGKCAERSEGNLAEGEPEERGCDA